jgi:uncharacterized alkaline shock family protein YloU
MTTDKQGLYQIGPEATRIMTMTENAQGLIEIAPAAIASLTAHVVTQTYGVVGMSTPSLASGIAATLTRDPHRGVEVKINPNQTIEIDLYVVLEYGTRIASVATSLINVVRYTVEKHCSLPVHSVKIHVQGIRVSS